MAANPFPDAVGRDLDPAVCFFARRVSGRGKVLRAAYTPPLHPMENLMTARFVLPAGLLLRRGQKLQLSTRVVSWQMPVWMSYRTAGITVLAA